MCGKRIVRCWNVDARQYVVRAITKICRWRCRINMVPSISANLHNTSHMSTIWLSWKSHCTFFDIWHTFHQVFYDDCEHLVYWESLMHNSQDQVSSKGIDACMQVDSVSSITQLIRHFIRGILWRTHVEPSRTTKHTQSQMLKIQSY